MGSAASAGFPGLEFDTYQLGLNADWDVDLFGGAHRAAAAGRDRAEAQVWTARDTDVTVTGEIAAAYLQLRADQAHLAVARAEAARQSRLLDLAGARSKGGLVSNVDFVSQRAQLANTQAEAPPLEASIEAGEHQLAILLDEAPGALAPELAVAPDAPRALPTPPLEIPVGLPADLLKRRPDVRAAERNLAAAVEDVGQATAALYPSLKLTGMFGFVSSELKTLLEVSSRNYSAAASLTAPIFDAGELRARKHQAEERAVQAELAYRQAVLTGLRETADALSHYAADQRVLVSLRAGVADADQAARLDRVQFDGGLSDEQNTLRAEATALQTREQLTETQRRLAGDLVTVYRALGGGWMGANRTLPDRQ